MNTVVRKLKALASDERGLTALDYGLTAGIVALALIGTASALGAKFTATIAALIGALQ